MIFTEEESQKIREGFVYVESTVQIDKSIEEALDDEVLDEHDFNNITITSTQDPMDRNMSSNSDILDPFNTSFSGGDMEVNEENILNQGYELYSAKEIGKEGQIIKFNLKTREINKIYQALNNGDHDNGVENQKPVDENKRDMVKAKKNSKKNKDEIKEELDRLMQGELPNVMLNHFIRHYETNSKKAFKVQQYGFPLEYVKKTVKANDCNFCTTVYYLENKDQSKIATNTK